MLSSKKKIAELEERLLITEKTVNTLTEAINDLYGKLREREEELDDKQREIRLWNEGLTNILNYSLETAKGGGK